MKKILLLLSVIGTLSCSSCAKSDTVSPPTCSDSGCNIDAHQPNLVKGDDWELVLPDDVQTLQPPVDSIKVFVSTNDGKLLLLFMKEKFAGTDEDYVNVALRGLEEKGVNIISRGTVYINGLFYSLVESEKDGIYLLTWITVKNGNGYGFSCAQTLNAKASDLICFEVANSVKIK